VLEDKAVRIARGASHFWLVGISDFWEGPHDLRGAFGLVTDHAPVLAFRHNPDVFSEIRQRFSLLIAGHTHGGQVHLPFLGRPIVPSKYGERFAYGDVVEGGRHLYVSPGSARASCPFASGCRRK
jgi:predicted MPP superfamily phosphohydrolase